MRLAVLLGHRGQIGSDPVGSVSRMASAQGERGCLPSLLALNHLSWCLKQSKVYGLIVWLSMRLSRSKVLMIEDGSVSEVFPGKGCSASDATLPSEYTRGEGA